jgi:hypothetical protein
VRERTVSYGKAKPNFRIMATPQPGLSRQSDTIAMPARPFLILWA